MFELKKNLTQGLTYDDQSLQHVKVKDTTFTLGTDFYNKPYTRFDKNETNDLDGLNVFSAENLDRLHQNLGVVVSLHVSTRVYT